MYQFSRAIYRDLAPLVAPRTGESAAAAHAHVLHACEANLARLASDRHYFAHPTRTLFNDIRGHFPVGSQQRVHTIVSGYLQLADRYLSQLPRNGLDANGRPLQCRALTRKGTTCQRMPLPHNGYCPSHQHLAETEDAEVLAA
jgi:hypothetical protein